MFFYLFFLFFSRDARKTEDKTFVAAPFQPVEPGTEWERGAKEDTQTKTKSKKIKLLCFQGCKAL